MQSIYNAVTILYTNIDQTLHFIREYLVNVLIQYLASICAHYKTVIDEHIHLDDNV